MQESFTVEQDREGIRAVEDPLEERRDPVLEISCPKCRRVKRLGRQEAKLCPNGSNDPEHFLLLHLRPLLLRKPSLGPQELDLLALGIRHVRPWRFEPVKRRPHDRAPSELLEAGAPLTLRCPCGRCPTLVSFLENDALLALSNAEVSLAELHLRHVAFSSETADDGPLADLIPDRLWQRCVDPPSRATMSFRLHLVEG